VADDQCAKVFTTWYHRCFQTLPGMPPAVSTELTHFDSLCNQTLANHHSTDWPPTLTVKTLTFELKDYTTHHGFLGMYSKTSLSCAGAPVYKKAGACGAACTNRGAGQGGPLPPAGWLFKHAATGSWAIAWSDSPDVECDTQIVVFDSAADSSEQCKACPFGSGCFPSGCKWQECVQPDWGGGAGAISFYAGACHLDDAQSVLGMTDLAELHVDPAAADNCMDFNAVNDACATHGSGRLVPSTCDDPKSVADDQCAKVFTAWFKRCYAKVPAATMAAHGDELVQFDEWCNKTLTLHQAGAKFLWPSSLAVKAQASELKDWKFHNGYLGTYTKTAASCAGAPVYKKEGACGTACTNRDPSLPPAGWLFKRAATDSWAISFSDSPDVECDTTIVVFDSAADSSEQCKACPFGHGCFPGGCRWQECVQPDWGGGSLAVNFYAGSCHLDDAQSVLGMTDNNEFTVEPGPRE
jgi:hypothetical protein